MEELSQLVEGYDVLATSGAVGSVAALLVGLSKRFGGRRFVLLREAWTVFAIVLAELGEAAKRIDAQLRESFPPKAALLLALLPLAGCTFTAANTPLGDFSWTIHDGSVRCTYDENGYPTGGPDCQASGGLSDAEADALARRAESREETEREKERLRNERKIVKLGGTPVAEELPEPDPGDGWIESLEGPALPDDMAPEEEVSDYPGELPPK